MRGKLLPDSAKSCKEVTGRTIKVKTFGAQLDATLSAAAAILSPLARMARQRGGSLAAARTNDRNLLRKTHF